MNAKVMDGAGKRAAGRALPRGVLSRRSRGQTVVEYLLMTLLLLGLFTGLYKVLQTEMRKAFIRAGVVILRAYY